ncbi:hypothetical protein AX17_004597 [Amanita inopinata Kibby_2008]|nr:hypothetical protein AX17_004597 [Amanita inopinata Kibby_2008]
MTNASNGIDQDATVLSRTMPAVEKAGHPGKHKEYYMPDGDVVIRVENTLFKLELSVLHAKSPVFRIIVPPAYGGRKCYTGFDDERPFVLREISATDFERLLWVIYPLKDTSKQLSTVEAWLSILKLSTKFQIDEIRPLAASKLHTLPIDPIRKIAIWEEYHLDPELLMSSYVILCQRFEPLTLQMTMALGLKNFTRLAAARDIYHYNLGCLRCGRKVTAKQRQALAQAAVTGVFLPPSVSFSKSQS